MTYVVMGRDECNQEFRCSNAEWETESSAEAEALEMYDKYPEARAIWVELLRDKAYYMRLTTQHQWRNDDGF